MNPYRRVLADQDQQATMAGLGTKFHSLHKDIEANLPDGPYKTEALKSLEIASFWANKGITHGKESV